MHFIQLNYSHDWYFILSFKKLQSITLCGVYNKLYLHLAVRLWYIWEVIVCLSLILYEQIYTFYLIITICYSDSQIWCQLIISCKHIFDLMWKTSAWFKIWYLKCWGYIIQSTRGSNWPLRFYSCSYRSNSTQTPSNNLQHIFNHLAKSRWLYGGIGGWSRKTEYGWKFDPKTEYHMFCTETE